MKVIAGGETFDLGATEAQPTISIVDYSRRETDDFGVTTVVPRGFARRMSVRTMVPFDQVDTLQRRLATLRAKPAQWVADAQFGSLSFAGFYKDFQIDLAVRPISFCTLTIEGLAETVPGADAGGDPAADGKVSTLQLLQPASVTDAMLVASNVPENDYAAWASGATYALGARVIAGHRIYESAAAGNVGNDPLAGSAAWLSLGPTNRWAMFDEALGSATENAGSVAVTIDPVDPVNAIALLDVAGSTVRVQASGYDRTFALTASPGMAAFLDLPNVAGAITVTIAGNGSVSVGTLLLGRLVGLGVTEASPTAGITDYSRKETDDFGEVTVVERAWAKRMAVRALLRSDAVDMVANRIAAVRARPCLWIGDAGVEALSIYGFFKDFSIEVGENVSTLQLAVEGLSTAGKIAPIAVVPGDVSWEDIKDDNPAKPKPEDGATVGATPEEKAKLELLQDAYTQTAAAAAAAAALAQQIQDSVTVDIDALTQQITSLGGSVELVQGTVGAQGALITTIQQTVSNQAGALASVTQTAETANALATANQLAITTANESIGQLSVRVGSAESDLALKATAITNLTGRMAGVEGSLNSRGAQVDFLLQATSTLQGDVATIKTQASAGKPNRLVNGTGEAGDLTGWYSGYGDWRVAPSANVWGQYFYVLNAGPAGDKFYHIRHDRAAWNAGYVATFTSGIDFSGSAPGCQGYLEVRFLDAGMQILGQYEGGHILNGANFGNDAENRRVLKVTTAPAPPGTVFVDATVIFYSPNGVSLNGGAFRQAKLEEGNVATSYSGEATAAQQAQALVTANQRYAELSSSVSVLGGTVNQQAVAIADINGKVGLYWQVAATGPNGEIYVRLVNANGQSGFIVGTDLFVNGNAFIAGTLNPSALALDRFVKRVGGGGAGTPNPGQMLLLYAVDLGVTRPNGSYALELSGVMTTNVGRTQTNLNNRPYFINNVPDGGLLVRIMKNGTVLAEHYYQASEYAGQTPAITRTLSLGITRIFDAPSNDTFEGNATLLIYALRGNADTGIVDQGDYYSRDQSAFYTNFSVAAKLKWTFI